ncbi:hypothetical protein DE146DRAFT_233716 [Phaeosphaeria sp. MPI-PUGE-AT-0046c]|nr:hypothetical protein DE146DRAFT_233716 [Phaeosphaeria sp. MPI-PUGE-AT-0046c]
MRHTILTASVLCGLAVALPQAINVGAAEALPTPTAGLGPQVSEVVPLPISYDQAAATASAAESVETGGIDTAGAGTVAKRDDACATQPGGKGSVPGDGSVSAYQDLNNALRQAAQKAATPSGYTQNFVDLTASVQEIGYLTYKNIEDGSYNVQDCATFCDSVSLCKGFNIYSERDPKVNPGTGCPNPEAITNVKCAIYGYGVSPSTAVNKGQYREQFHVIIVGSNGYSKTSGTCNGAPTVPKFNAPTNLPAAINAPTVTKDGKKFDTYNGVKVFNGGPYDPSLCAAACQAQTANDKSTPDSNGEYRPCNFFQSYILTKNGTPLGTYCAFYTQAFGTEYAVNSGYYSGSDVYKVECATSYALTNQDSGMVSPSP